MRMRKEQLVIAGCGVSLDEHVDDSLELLKEHEPDGGYYGCFSGGKDSVVIKELARMADVRVEWHYNVTTIDPPELVRFIRREHPDVIFNRPKVPFFKMFVVRGAPTRVARWCCEIYKETRSPKGAVLIIGIRAEESPRRASMWKDVTWHETGESWAVSPILRWDVEHVWGFIDRRGIPYCELYDDGFDRLGCVGCPMARKNLREKQFARWPQYERLWRKAFRDLWEYRQTVARETGKTWKPSTRFSGWEEMFDWWASDVGLSKPDQCQLDMWS